MARWHGLQISARAMHCCIAAAWRPDPELSWAKTGPQALDTKDNIIIIIIIIKEVRPNLVYTFGGWACF